MKDDYNLHLSLATCITGEKDIFLYNVRGIKVEDMDISQGFYFVRQNKGKIAKISQHSDIKPDKGEELLFRIRKSKNKNYSIESPICKKMENNKKCISNLNNKLWYILKSSSNKNRSNNIENYILNKYDIIKIGDSKYEIIEKNIEEKDNNEENDYDDNNINYLDLNDQYNISKNNKSESIFNITKIKKADYKNENENNLCRICLDGSSSIENPKLILCNCHDFIHYQCLKAWIKTKLIKRENSKKTVNSYILKKFNCEVCLNPYPLKFEIPEIKKQYYLIDLPILIGQNYIILESLGIFLDNNEIKMIHIVKLTDEYITIGRKEYSDIMDNNYHISKEHAVIKYNKKNGDVILENRSQNFDTLVLVKKPIIIKEKEIDLQIGKTIITANLINNKLINTYPFSYLQ